MKIIALGIAFFGVLSCVARSLAIYTSQMQFSGSTLWPLPGLVLLLWALLGLLASVAAFLSLFQASLRWLHGLILLTDAFIPLIIIRAFSLGTLVMLGFLLFVISTVILAIRKKAKFLESFGLLMLGAIVNPGILYAIITLGNLSTRY